MSDTTTRLPSYQDVSPRLAAHALKRGRPQSEARMVDPSPLTAWPDVPTRVLIGREDRLFPVAFLRRVARQRLGITPDEIDSGHTPALSRPVELADRLERYAAENRAYSAATHPQASPARRRCGPAIGLAVVIASLEPIIVTVMRTCVVGRPNPFLVAIATALVALAGAGCGDSKPADVVAVQVNGARVEIIYAACKPEAVNGVAVLVPSDTAEFRESDPPVWQVSFPKPRPSAGTFVVGETRDRAIVDVPLQSPLDRGQTYMAVIHLDGGERIHQAFVLESLDGGRIAYADRYVSAADFTSATSCPTP